MYSCKSLFHYDSVMKCSDSRFEVTVCLIRTLLGKVLSISTQLLPRKLSSLCSTSKVGVLFLEIFQLSELSY